MQLSLFDPPDPTVSRTPAIEGKATWEQLDEAARDAAIEILGRLVTRMLAREPAKEACDD